MHNSVMQFVRIFLSANEIRGKRILEVGSRDENGSVRPYIEGWAPASYLGIDMRRGPRVDRVLRCEDLVQILGERTFDIVVCVNMLEHAEDWRACLRNMMGVISDRGWLLLTVPGPGFPYHGFPHDYWRFSTDDFERILEQAHFEAWSVQPDPEQAGVFVKACKPADWKLSDDAWLEITPLPPG